MILIESLVLIAQTLGLLMILIGSIGLCIALYALLKLIKQIREGEPRGKKK